MHIVLLCATNRGLRFLKALIRLYDGCKITVFSFSEEPNEPRFFDAIRDSSLNAGATFIEARSLGNPRHQEFFEKNPIDLLLAVSWRYMVPPTIYQSARLGAYVFHDSLLPKYRGFSPTVWAIINGEDHTGVTLFKMSEAVDAGPVVDQKKIPIGPDDTIPTVLENVTLAYLELLEKNHRVLMDNTVTLQEQNHSLATYTCRRIADDNQINWSLSASKIFNLIRAVTAPYPGAYTFLNGRRIYIWAAERLRPTKKYIGNIPGRVVEVVADRGVIVLTGDEPLLVTLVQYEGDVITNAVNVLNRQTYTLGE